MTGLTHEFSFPIAATPERVFRALTQPDELKRWFCEHAEIDLKVGGAFRFWGRYTYGTPTRAAAQAQKVLRLETDAVIAFSWSLAGQPTEVTLSLARGDSGTTLKGAHVFPQPPAKTRARELVDDLWRLNCGNLAAYLAEGTAALMTDFNDAEPQVRASILVNAPRERVFEALLEPDVLNRWIAGAASVEPRVGGRYTYGWSYKIDERDVQGGPTRILELVPNEKLVVDWPDWRGDTSVPVQKVTWLLESQGTQTRLTVIHSGFVRATDISDYPYGWLGFLRQLKQTLESDST
jgi:uncharacterized protein YndB with AHSA1/START domain